MKLSIIILCYNKYNFTKSCLDDLSKLSNDTEIIVYDNGSTDETHSKLMDTKEFRYIRSDINFGFGPGNNKAYELSSGDNVLFLNNDIRVKDNFENWTDKLIDPISLTGPTMGLLDKDFNFVKEENRLLLGGNSYMSGWCICGSRQTWEKLKENNKIFDERYPHFFEDTDLSFRAKELKIPFKVIDIPVVHFGKISGKQLNIPKLYQTSKKLFIEKWK